jgi:hypothetical protein
MSRWIRFFVVFFIGLAASLFYAWIINPVKLVETSPDTLREDYKADYVLMVAEIYHADGNLEQATQRLALLGNATPGQIVDAALTYARGEMNDDQAIYPVEDLEMMQLLVDALKTIQATPDKP